MDPMGYVSMGELSLSEGIQNLSQLNIPILALGADCVRKKVIRNYKDQTYKLHKTSVYPHELNDIGSS